MASITEIPHSTETYERDCWGRTHWIPKSIRDVLITVFDLDTFRSPTYVLLLISTSLTMFGKCDYFK